MTEVVFAGECVGQMRIRDDLVKLTAVVNWPTPTTIQNLEAFLGLTGVLPTTHQKLFIT